MVGKEHIDRMKLLGRMLDGSVELPATAIAAGLEYARRLHTDTKLQAEVKAMSKSDLAARDFKRAAQVVAKYDVQPAVKTVTPTAVTPTPKPAVSPASKYSMNELESHSVRVRLSNRYVETVKGEAWRLAGYPPLDTFIYTPPGKDPLPPPKEPDLTPVKQYLTVTHGLVTFEKVPHMYRIGGKSVKELLITAGVIDAKLRVTDKGKEWLGN